MSIKIIIFDLDGTLLNTLGDLTDSTNFALDQFGYPGKTVEEVRNYVGNGVFKLMERAIPQGADNPNFEKIVCLFKNHYRQNISNKTKPYEDIVELLEYLKINGIKVAVVSNKFDTAVKELCDKYFPNLIDIAIGENESGGLKKKPAPDMVLKVLDLLNFSTQDALYVGDSEVDIQTAMNSGIGCLSVTWGFKDKKFLMAHGAEIIVDSPEEIIRYLD